MQPSFNSILFKPSDQKLPSNHPVQYTSTRCNLLNTMINQIQLKSNLNPSDLQRNVHVQYLTRAYDKMKQKMILKQKQKQRYLNPNDFETILDTRRSKQNENEQIMRFRLQKQRTEMYQKYIENYVEEQKDFDEPQIQLLPPRIQMKMSEDDRRIILMRQRQMELLDEEIDHLRLDIEQSQKDQRNRNKNTNPTHNCTNLTLIERMSGSLISSYMIHFDEIFGLLMDEILQEQVEHLNEIENDWKKNERQWKYNIDRERRTEIGQKQFKVIELIKHLDDLCDI